MQIHVTYHPPRQPPTGSAILHEDSNNVTFAVAPSFPVGILPGPEYIICDYPVD